MPLTLPRRVLLAVALLLAAWGCKEIVTAPGISGGAGQPRALRLDAPSVTRTVGASTRVTAQLLDATGQPVAVPTGLALTYTSSAPTVFSVTGDGTVSGLASGAGVLRAAVGALQVGVPVTVTPSGPRLIRVSGDVQSAAPGAALPLPLRVRALRTDGSPAADLAITFAPTAGTVTPASAVTNATGETSTSWTLGATAGPQSVTASALGYASATFTATAAAQPITGITVTPTPVALTSVGQTQQLTAVARDAQGTVVPVANFTWTTSNASVAAVSPAGLVTAISNGSATMAAAVGAVSGGAQVTVTLPVSQARIAFVPDSLILNVSINGPRSVAAANVLDGNGGPEAGLGTVTCGDPDYPVGARRGWLRVEACGDSIRVSVAGSDFPDGGALTLIADVRVRATLASNSPRLLRIVLNVTPGAVPVITTAPSGPVTFVALPGAANGGVFPQVVGISNSGGGSLTGLTAALTYAPGQATGWLESLALDGPAAPTALRFTVRRGALPVGVYDATVRLTSTVAGVQPLDIPVRLDVRAGTARLGLSPDSMRVVNWTGGPAVRRAVDIREENGLGDAALGAITCGDPAYSNVEVNGWVTILRCTDSLVVSSVPIVEFDGSVLATIRVAAANAPDTVVFKLLQTAEPPTFTFTPTALSVLSRPNGTPFRVAAAVALTVPVGSPTQFPRANLGTLACRVIQPDGTPPAMTIERCAVDSVAVSVTPNATTGSFRYAVEVAAPNATVRFREGYIDVNVNYSTADAPVIGVSPSGPIVLTSAGTLSRTDGVSRTLAITNSGSGTLSGLFLTSFEQEPIEVRDLVSIGSPGVSSTAPTTLTVFASRDPELPPGTYSRSFFVRSTDPRVAPVEIPVTYVVVPDTSVRLAPDQLDIRTWAGAPATRAAVDIQSRNGIPEAALGALTCVEPPTNFPNINPGELRVLGCGDSLVVEISASAQLVGTIEREIRVTAANARDTAFLRIALTADRPSLRLTPPSLSVVSLQNGTPFRVAAAVAVSVPPGTPAFPRAELGPLSCRVLPPAGAPPMTIDRCDADSVAVRVTPNAASGTFSYRVEVTAPRGAAPVDPGVLTVTVNFPTTPPWSQVGVPSLQRALGSVAFAGPSVAVALGNDARYIRSVDAGLTWTSSTSPISTNESGSVAFAGANVGVIVTSRVGGGSILRTTDAGASWLPVFSSGRMNKVAFGSASVGVAVGDDLRILRTTDAGVTWTQSTVSAGELSITDVAFGDVNTVFATSSGTIRRSTDGGQTFSTVNTPPPTVFITAVAFSSAQVGVVVGFRGSDVYWTADGGQTWTRGTGAGLASSGINFRDVVFLDANTAIAVGVEGLSSVGVILRTDDGGRTWRSIDAGISRELGHNAVAFASPTVGLVTGGAGSVLRTTTGGQ